MDFPIDLVYTLKDYASGAANAMKNALSSVDQAVMQNSKSFDAMAKAAEVAAGVLIADVVNGVTAAATSSLELGAQMQTLRASFEQMKNQTGGVSLSLDELRAATRGTVSDVDLLTTANKAMSLGLPTDDLGDLMAAAMKLGRVMGIDTLSAVDSLATGIGRQSKLILDNLGVTFDASEAYDWYAQKMGVSSSALDENTKKLAWQTYAIELVSERAAQLGDIQDEGVTAQEQWAASIENAQTALGEFLGPLTGLKGAFEMVIPLISAVAMGVLPGLISSYGIAGTASYLFAGATSALSTAFTFLEAHPIILVITGIAAALIIAYNACPPFRDAVNAIAQALGEGLGKAAEWVKGALDWLWKNVLVPLGNWLNAVFGPVIDWLGEKLQWLADLLAPVGEAFNWLAGVIGDAWNSATKAIEEYNEIQEAAALSAKNGLSVMANYYGTKFGEMTDTVDANLAEQLEIIEASYADMKAAEEAAFEQSVADYKEAWKQRYDAVETALTEVQDLIEEHYKDLADEADKSFKNQIDSLEAFYRERYGIEADESNKVLDLINKHYDERLDAADEGLNSEIDALVSYFNQKYGIETAESSRVLDVVNHHYDEETDRVQQAYSEQLDATNRFYDDMLSAASAGLEAIKRKRNDDLNALELDYLMQKIALNDLHKSNLISEEEYNAQMKALEEKYRTERSDISDRARLEQLKAEAELKDETVKIETERAEAIADIQANQNAELALLDAQRAEDLAAAKAREKELEDLHTAELAAINAQREADLAAARVRIQTLEAEHAALILEIEQQKNAALIEAVIEYETMLAEHAARQVQIELDKANAIEAAERAAAEQKKEMLAQFEAEINANTKLSADEKKQIIADMNAAILEDSKVQWTNIATEISAAMQRIQDQNKVFKEALEQGIITAKQYQEAMEKQNQNTAAQQQKAMVNSQNAIFYEAYKTGKITYAQYQEAIKAQPKLAEGALVTRPTDVTVGEGSEPEGVAPISVLVGILKDALRSSKAAEPLQAVPAQNDSYFAMPVYEAAEPELFTPFMKPAPASSTLDLADLEPFTPEAAPRVEPIIQVMPPSQEPAASGPIEISMPVTINLNGDINSPASLEQVKEMVKQGLGDAVSEYITLKALRRSR